MKSTYQNEHGCCTHEYSSDISFTSIAVVCVCVCVCGAKAGLDSGRWPFYNIFKRLSYEDLKHCCKRILDAVEVLSDIGYCNQQGQKEHVLVQKVFQ